MKSYDSYQSTPDAVWFSSIPLSWKAQKMRELFSERRTKVSDSDYPALSVGKMGIVPQLDTAVKTDNGDNRKLIRKGDFAINSRSDRKGSGGISEYDGSCSLIITVLKPHETINGHFYHYLLRSHYFSEEFYRNGYGIVADLWTTKWKTMRNIYLPVPPREEQDQIVKFLDWKVSDFNRLIAMKKKEIQLFRERREAAINEAVTQGIRGTKLKPSGMNWLQAIPENWETIPAKALFSHVSELRHDGDEMLAATQKYGMISQKQYMELEGRRIVLATDNLDKWLHVEPDEFIISLRSFQGGLELCTITGCVTWHYVVLKPNEKVYVPYYRWLFKSAAYIGALQRTSDFIRDGQDLRYSNFVKVRLMDIPYDEQREIAEYLDKTIPMYDAKEEKLLKEVSLLQELKTRLISDVVTGQVDIQNIDVPVFEYVADETDDGSNENVDGEEIDDQEE